MGPGSHGLHGSNARLRSQSETPRTWTRALLSNPEAPHRRSEVRPTRVPRAPLQREGPVGPSALGPTRTGDLRFRKALLYPTELRGRRRLLYYFDAHAASTASAPVAHVRRGSRTCSAKFLPIGRLRSTAETRVVQIGAWGDSSVCAKGLGGALRSRTIPAPATPRRGRDGRRLRGVRPGAQRARRAQDAEEAGLAQGGGAGAARGSSASFARSRTCTTRTSSRSGSSSPRASSGFSRWSSSRGSDFLAYVRPRAPDGGGRRAPRRRGRPAAAPASTTRPMQFRRVVGARPRAPGRASTRRACARRCRSSRAGSRRSTPRARSTATSSRRTSA